MAQTLPAKTTDNPKGKTLVVRKGMTLYTFDKDRAASRVQRTLRRKLAAADGGRRRQASGDWTVVIRDDGKMMWAYKGKPLYAFKKDAEAGDTNGDGFMKAYGTWPRHDLLGGALRRSQAQRKARVDARSHADEAVE